MAGFQVRSSRNPDGTYTLSFGKGSKKLQAIGMRVGKDKWQVTSGHGPACTSNTKQDLKADWGRWAAAEYGSGSCIPTGASPPPPTPIRPSPPSSVPALPKAGEVRKPAAVAPPPPCVRKSPPPPPPITPKTNLIDESTIPFGRKTLNDTIEESPESYDSAS